MSLWKLTVNEPDGPARVKLYATREGAETAAQLFYRPGVLMTLESVTPYNPHGGAQ
jgi:hypothetical protein